MPISEKDIFLKISQATSRISNLERLLKRSVKISAQAISVDRCSIWLTDDDKKSAMVKAVYVKGRFDPVHLGARVDINKFPKFKRIISEGKIIHSPDISKLAANRSEKKFFAEAKIKSSLSVPLKIKNKVLGAFNIGTLGNYKTFTPSEIKLCQIIANQIAVGIENARLYKKLEHRASLLQEQSIKALRESEEKYRTLLENLPQLIFLKDKKSVYISANKNCCKPLGIKPEEIKGKTDFDFFPKELAKKYRKDDRDIIKTGRTKEIIEDYIEKGERKIVQTVKTPVLGDGGKPIGVLGIFWDITERKRAEEELRESEERYRLLFERNLAGVYRTTVDGKILDCNQSYVRMLGYDSKEEILSAQVWDFYLERSDRETLVSLLRKRKMLINYEICQKRKDASILWAITNASLLPEKYQGSSIIEGTLIDITEHKKVEEKLKKSEERYRTLIETSNDMIFTVDSRGNFLFTNKAFEKILGYSDEEIKKINGFELVHPQDLKIVKKQFAQLLKGKNMDNMEYRYKTKDGSYIHILNNASPIFDSQGNVVSAFGIARDITERKRAEEALRKSKDLTTILQISYKITQILNLDKMLELACQETAKALEVERCAVLLLDKKENAGIIKAIYIKNQPHPWILGARLLLKDFPRLVKLYQQKERFLHAPVIKNAPLSRKEKDYFRKEKVKSFVVVPIGTGKRLLGTFLVETMEKERVFTKSEIAFVQTLANHLAIAVENAKLMELVKEQTENLKTLSQQVIRTQEEERRKIAQELHDEIGQALTVMKINIEMSKQKIPSEFTQVIDRIKENEELIVQTLEKVRNLTTDLRPPTLDDLGLVPTLNWYIQSFSKRTNIKVTFKTNHCRGRFPLDLEMVLYRINQEALTNVAKHAKATRVSITLEKKNNYALLTVKDDGVGFDIKKIMSERKVKKGFGLFNIKERVKLLNGDFNVISKPKKGTRLKVRIPCPRGR